MQVLRKVSLFIFLLFVFDSFGQVNYGSIDTTFNPNDIGFSYNQGKEFCNTQYGVNDFFVHPNGQITICGGFQFFNGYYRQQAVRLNANHSVDPTFEVNFNTNEMNWTLGVVVMDIQSSGKVIVGGDFLETSTGTSTAYRRIARLDSNGNADQTFWTGPNFNDKGTNDVVEDIEVLPDDKVLVAGRFSSFGGTPANHLMKMNPDGGLDNTFNIGIGLAGNYDFLNRVKVMGNGKIMIAGSFNSWNNLPNTNLVRLNSNGSLDQTFSTGSGPNGFIFAIHELANGKIAIGGDFTSYNNIPCNRFCILNPDGTLDPNYIVGSGFSDAVYAISSDATGNIYVGGNFNTYKGITSPYFVCISSTGAFNNNFVSGFNDKVNVIKAQPDGSILLGGAFYGYNSYAIHSFARILATGAIDTMFNRSSGANNELLGCKALPQKNALIFGRICEFQAYNGTLVPSSIAKIDSVGRLCNNAFIDLPFSDVYTAFVDTATNKVLIGGTLEYGTGPPYTALIRTDLNGNLDPTFTSQIPENISETEIFDIDPVQNNKYLITHQQVNDLFVNRINENGTIDNSFNQINITNGFTRTTVLSDNRFLVYGDYNTYNSSVATYLACFNEDGTLDFSFNIGTGPNGIIELIKELPNGKLFVSGEFTTWNGSSKPGYVFLNNNGSVANGYSYPLNYTSSQYVKAMEILPSGKLLIGTVSSANTSDPPNLMLLYPNGTIDQNFTGYRTPNVDGLGWISEITGFDSEGFYIVGSFGSVNNSPANNIERFNYHTTDIGYSELTSCGSYICQNGQTYTSSQDSIYYSVVTSNGSDSMIILNLTILNSPIVAQAVLNPDNSITASGGIYYQWINCDNNQWINNATSATFVPTGNGSYAAIVGNETDCNDTTNCIDFNTAGINELPAFQVQLIPNPTTDFQTVIFQGMEAQLTIHDAQGKLIQTSNIISGDQVSLKDLQLGVYLFDFKNSQGHSVQRVVKQ
nr:T9SS type A sorting domain-containing protein [uncultured Fluviicola sp.]